MTEKAAPSLGDFLDRLEGKVSPEILEEVRNFAFVVETSPRKELPWVLVQLETLVSLTGDRIREAVSGGELPETALELLRRRKSKPLDLDSLG